MAPGALALVFSPSPMPFWAALVLGFMALSAAVVLGWAVYHDIRGRWG